MLFPDEIPLERIPSLVPAYVFDFDDTLGKVNVRGKDPRGFYLFLTHKSLSFLRGDFFQFKKTRNNPQAFLVSELENCIRLAFIQIEPIHIRFYVFCLIFLIENPDDVPLIISGIHNEIIRMREFHTIGNLDCGRR